MREQVAEEPTGGERDEKSQSQQQRGLGRSMVPSGFEDED